MEKQPPTDQHAEFDVYADEYERALQLGLSVSGESSEYFARARVRWLGRCLAQLHCEPRTILDFGCGVGSAAPHLLHLPAAESVTGVDVSPASVKVAQRSHGSDRARFLLRSESVPEGRMSLAYCNGVFHHIPPTERASAVSYVFDHLRPGGYFSLWENNPWNPGTRFVMSRIPFDRDAVTLSFLETRRLLRAGGFQIARIDFLFVFPRVLSVLRPLERLLSRLPLGAQYHVLCRRPPQPLQ